MIITPSLLFLSASMLARTRRAQIFLYAIHNGLSRFILHFIGKHRFLIRRVAKKSDLQKNRRHLGLSDDLKITVFHSAVLKTHGFH